MPAALDEQRGLVEVAVVAGDPGQLDQGRLDLGVPADRLDAVRAERRADVVGGAADGADEPSSGARTVRARATAAWKGARGSTARGPTPGR